MKQVLFILLLIHPFFLRGQKIEITEYKDGEGKFYWGGTIALSAINGATTYFNVK